MSAASAIKIMSGQLWGECERDRWFRGVQIDIADVYIHLSRAEQVEGTLEKHFAGQSGLHIAEVDLTLLGDAIRWEEARGGALFPHLYGDLPIDAVVTVTKRD